MSAHRKNLPNKKIPSLEPLQEVEDQSQEDIEGENICPNENQPVQISSAEAELYFEYLRKKISHQAKDPFSLPFLNLKFEQLESSWKGATEQLNLESRIYGMRVDNCHDNTIKMLNHVIRNQQDQIDKDAVKTQGQLKNEENRQNNQQKKSNPNYYLDSPQKHILAPGTLNKLENMSLWNVIFKKSQTLSQIQLNTIELSHNLALELDLKSVNYQPKESDFNNHSNPISMDIENNFLERYPYFNQVLEIYKEIQTLRKEIMEELGELQAKRKDKKKTLKTKQIQNPLWEMNLGIRDIDFTDFQQDFNEFQKYFKEEDNSQSDSHHIFQPNFLDQPRERIFTPKIHELQTIQIDPITEENFEGASDEQDDNLETDLYQPQRDFLFNLTCKKTKKCENRKMVRIKRTKNTNIDFDNSFNLIDRKRALNNKKLNPANRKNNNLVPINYVVIYEGRNPFKKIKKTTRNRAKLDLYDPNNFILAQNELVSKPFESTNNLLMNQDDIINSNYIDQETQHLNENHENQWERTQESEQKAKFIKHVPIKKVKQEMIRELKNCEESLMISRQINGNQSFLESFKLDQTSYMDTNLQEEASMIGLRFFKEKMKSYDPLDILVSMLHVAFEQQVILQPLYVQNQEGDGQNDLVLKDILIPTDHLM